MGKSYLAILLKRKNQKSLSSFLTCEPNSTICWEEPSEVLGQRERTWKEYFNQGKYFDTKQVTRTWANYKLCAQAKKLVACFQFAEQITYIRITFRNRACFM